MDNQTGNCVKSGFYFVGSFCTYFCAPWSNDCQMHLSYFYENIKHTRWQGLGKFHEGK